MKQVTSPNTPVRQTNPALVQRWKKIHDTILKGPHKELQEGLDDGSYWLKDTPDLHTEALASGAVVLPAFRQRDRNGVIVLIYTDVKDYVGSAGSVANAEAYYGENPDEEAPGSREAPGSACQPDGPAATEIKAPNYDSGRTPEGKTWTLRQLPRDFHILAYLAPYVTVVRRSDGVMGSLEFTLEPRIYWDFRYNPNAGPVRLPSPADSHRWPNNSRDQSCAKTRKTASPE